MTRVDVGMRTEQVSSKQRDIWQMFDRIAGRYDLANHLLSFGQDIRWRHIVGRFLPESESLRILDLATGTGDLALAFAPYRDRIKSITCVDMSNEMLDVGTRKIKEFKLDHLISFQRADAANLPFANETFDCISIGFGIRNVCETEKALREMHRVLKANGRVLIIEFSLPQNGFIRVPYLAYFRHILPLLGGIISGDFEAYRYLNNTAEHFPSGEAFAKMIKSAGFGDVKTRTLSLGVATIYSADK